MQIITLKVVKLAQRNTSNYPKYTNKTTQLILRLKLFISLSPGLENSKEIHKEINTHCLVVEISATVHSEFTVKSRVMEEINIADLDRNC